MAHLALWSEGGATFHIFFPLRSRHPNGDKVSRINIETGNSPAILTFELPLEKDTP